MGGYPGKIRTDTRQPVLQSEEIYSGQVVWFDVRRGFGWIKRDKDGMDFYVNYRQVSPRDDGFQTLDKDEHVTFMIGIRGSKNAAVNVVRLKLGDELDVPGER